MILSAYGYRLCAHCLLTMGSHSKRCLRERGTKQYGFECHGQGSDKEANRLSTCAWAADQLGAPEAEDASLCPRGERWVRNREGEIGRNSTEESGAAALFFGVHLKLSPHC